MAHPIRYLSAALLVGALLVALAGCGSGESYPTKPIVVNVAWAAGGGSDVMARSLVNIINNKKYLSQPLQVVNQPGASGTIGLDAVVKSRPDGYTIGYEPSAPILVQPQVKELPYDYKSFIPVIQVFTMPTMLVVRSDAQWKTAKELLDYAKANPGKVRVGSSGTYTWGDVASMDLINASKIDLQRVAFESAAPEMTALLGGHIEAAAPQTADMASFVKDGKVRVLAAMEKNKVAAYPDVPSLKELGYDIQGTFFRHWVIVPLNTPKEIVQTLHDAYKKAVDDPEFARFSKEQGGEVAYLNTADSVKEIETGMAAVTKLLDAAGIQRVNKK